jgi:hypothetical protein
VVLVPIIKTELLKEILKRLHNGPVPICSILLTIGQQMFAFGPKQLIMHYVFNRLPNLANGLLPNEIWSSCCAPTEEFNQSHVFGCPVYVLHATLQDKHKIPKWAPQARLGVFLGFSTLHSSQVSLVMNVDTGNISPQFHAIFDDKFETVLSMALGDSINDQWKLIFCLK